MFRSMRGIERNGGRIATSTVHTAHLGALVPLLLREIGAPLRDNLLGPDAEALQRVRAERRGDRDVRGVAAARDQDAPAAGDVVSRIERVPGPAEIRLE